MIGNYSFIQYHLKELVHVLWKSLNGGTVRPFSTHLGGTEPLFSTHLGGTVPPLSTQLGGTFVYSELPLS